MYSGIHTPNDAPAFQHPTNIPVEQGTHSTSLAGFTPVIESDLDERIYQESQAITGGEFQSWYHALTPDERASYGRVYGH